MIRILFTLLILLVIPAPIYAQKLVSLGDEAISDLFIVRSSY